MIPSGNLRSAGDKIWRAVAFQKISSLYNSTQKSDYVCIPDGEIIITSKRSFKC
jgi:hypothetical protein